MRFRVLLILLFITFSVKAQEDLLIKDLLTDIAENFPEDYDFSALEEKLIFLRKHPIDLNHTSAEELKDLIFISPLQIDNLLKYLKTNGELTDLLELQNIDGFDVISIERLLPFVTLDQSGTIDKISYKNILVFSEHDLVLRYGRIFETQKGFRDLKGSHYTGSPNRFLLRYKYNYSNRISASLIAEKDAGEKFFKGEKQLAFDFQSAHLGIYRLGRLKKVIIGDYSLQFGQGLTLWSGFSFNKAPDVVSLVKNAEGLRAYTSANEYSFFRGVSGTVKLTKNIDFTPFVSSRNLDASLKQNGEEYQLETINQTGLHRTATEIENRYSVKQRVYGGVVQYQQNSAGFGAIVYQSEYDHSFSTGTKPYRSYTFEGKQLTNIGLHYQFTLKNAYFFGEAAKSQDGGMAFLNGILFSLSSKTSMVLLHRSYDGNYHNFFSQAIGESGETANEKGLYAGLNINFSKRWSTAFYTDYFRFPWLKFRVDAPSGGYEILGQLTYSPNKKTKMVFRYKSELKQQNTDAEIAINYLDDVKKQSYRADANWQIDNVISFQHRFEISQFKKGVAASEFGWMVYQDIAYSPVLARLSGNMRLAYFHTPSYNSRIYAFEDDVLYNFSFGLYNGNGFRTYLNLKYKLIKKLDCWARYAMFLYRNAETVGSGLDEINGNRKSDIKIQLRYQF